MSKIQARDVRKTAGPIPAPTKMIQVRDVPTQVHHTLKARAAREGMSLSDFVKRELERIVERPTMREWLARTKEMRPIPAKQTAAQIVRELRESR